MAFYVLFALVIYPVHGSLHFNGMFEALSGQVPSGLHGLLKVVENWTFSLFYCIAELWGSVVISVLFWTLANEVGSCSPVPNTWKLAEFVRVSCI